MDMHKNARLTPHSRAELVRRVETASVRRLLAWSKFHRFAVCPEFGQLVP